LKNLSKIFIVSFLFFTIALMTGSYSYIKEKNTKLESNIGGGFYNKTEKTDLGKSIINKLEIKRKEPESYESLKVAIEKSNRINLLIMGLEDIRTDTIIFASFCPDSKKISLMNIPRDSYIHRKGYNRAEERKINSIYGSHGVNGLKKAVSYILDDVPIHHHIILDYKGVEKIVDEIGGVEVDVPIHMKYKDPTANPPLNIDIIQGRHILDGKTSLEFLRYRKGTNKKDGYIDGDLGRIKAQQNFMQSFIEKSSNNAVALITKGFGHVKTDISLMKSLSYGRKTIGMNKDDFELLTLPGKAEFKKINKTVLSYFTYNKSETTKLLQKIYNVKGP